MIQIVPKVLQGSDYYKVKSMSTIQAAQVGLLNHPIYSIIQDIELLITTNFDKQIVYQRLPGLIRNLQDLVVIIQKGVEIGTTPTLVKSTLDETMIKTLFIQNGPFVGAWFSEVPVGLKRILQDAREAFKEVIERGEHWTWEQIRNLLISKAKHIDLVFVESDKPICLSLIHI